MRKFLKMYVFILLTFLFYKLIFSPMSNLTNPDFESARSLILSDYLKSQKIVNSKQKMFKIEEYDCLNYFFTKDKIINTIKDKKIVESTIPQSHQKVLFVVSKEGSVINTIVLNEPIMLEQKLDLKDLLDADDKVIELIDCPIIKDKTVIIDIYNREYKK